jgi:hypothetical protein
LIVLFVIVGAGDVAVRTGSATPTGGFNTIDPDVSDVIIAVPNVVPALVVVIVSVSDDTAILTMIIYLIYLS